jgi:hypothetical protein
MLEHRDPEELDVLRRPEDIASWRWVGREDDKADFPNGRPFDLRASREEPERPSG